jgi:alpha-galactosidase
MKQLLVALLFALLLAPLATAQITVTVNRGGTIVIHAAKAEFEVSPGGSIRSYLLNGGARLTLDEPIPGETGESVRVDGKPFGPFVVASSRVVTRASGPRGKRVEIPARAGTVERTTVIEAYEDSPGMLLTTVTYKNAGTAAVKLDEVMTQQHRLNAALSDPTAQSDRLWSFHGASVPGKPDDVVEITQDFARPNVMGAALPHGEGGGVPVVAFWTGRVGLAIGHLDKLPLALSMPVKVANDRRVRAALAIQPDISLKPGESYSTPVTFAMVYSGDYYEPLRAYSLAMQRRGWQLAKPSDEAYSASWCGWGYRSNFTAAQMLGVIPKLKEFGLKWATADDRWFDAYGDWNPRADNFPGDSLKQMVNEYHKNGILVQLWWLPIGASVAGPRSATRDARVVGEHPDWLVLDKNGKPAIMARDLVTLCPALPAVQQYHKQLTEKFVRDWGFDGHKLDVVYSVPPCYNAQHHHKSPYDSVNAMSEIFRIIFETTRSIKPRSVTQSCPCGTPPNFAWLPYMDQAVTADPMSSAQLRWRTKMYKALLGPQSAVYGDHVERSEVARGERKMLGDGEMNFASTVGTGGVVGTRFVWPQTDPEFSVGILTPEKNQRWKQWIGTYQEKMLSRGEFLNLYTYGYDVPEGYAIRKDGKMYYAFFAKYSDETWKGEIELRGLGPGKYRVVDYVRNKERGTVDAKAARLPVEFTGSLLLEAINH